MSINKSLSALVGEPCYATQSMLVSFLGTLLLGASGRTHKCLPDSRPLQSERPSPIIRFGFVHVWQVHGGSKANGHVTTPGQAAFNASDAGRLYRTSKQLPAFPLAFGAARLTTISLSFGRAIHRRRLLMRSQSRSITCLSETRSSRCSCKTL
jgi:hypothetical protein